MNYVAKWTQVHTTPRAWRLGPISAPHYGVAVMRRATEHGDDGYVANGAGVSLIATGDTLAQCADDAERWATVRGDLPAGPIDRSALG